MQRQVWVSAYFSVRADAKRKVVRVERSSKGFEGGHDLFSEFQKLNRELDKIGRASYALLVDLRAAPGRNDPQFEEQFANHRVRLLTGFRRAVVLVRTAAGKMQAERLRRTDQLAEHVRVFDNEAEALAFLDREEEPTPDEPA